MGEGGKGKVDQSPLSIKLVVVRFLFFVVGRLVLVIVQGELKFVRRELVREI